MRLFIVCLAALALLFASSATACPPVDPDGGGNFSSFGAGYGADACAAPMVAGNFGVGGGYGGGAMFAAPSYAVQSFAAPSYSYGSVGFAAPAPIFTRRQFRAQSVMPVYGGGFGGRRFSGGFRGSYGAAVVTAPVVHTRAFAAPAYGVTAVAPVVAVPVRAPGPIRGAVQGFFGGVRNRLNGF